MKVTLDEYGKPLADAHMPQYVAICLHERYDMHVSNELAITLLRAALYKMPKEDRPTIQWFFYDREVHFDGDLRSHDAWQDPRTELCNTALDVLLGWDNPQPRQVVTPITT